MEIFDVIFVIGIIAFFLFKLYLKHHRQSENFKEVAVFKISPREEAKKPFIEDTNKIIKIAKPIRHEWVMQPDGSSRCVSQKQPKNSVGVFTEQTTSQTSQWSNRDAPEKFCTRIPVEKYVNGKQPINSVGVFIEQTTEHKREWNHSDVPDNFDISIPFENFNYLFGRKKTASALRKFHESSLLEITEENNKVLQQVVIPEDFLIPTFPKVLLPEQYLEKPVVKELEKSVDLQLMSKPLISKPKHEVMENLLDIKSFEQITMKKPDISFQQGLVIEKPQPCEIMTSNFEQMTAPNISRNSGKIIENPFYRESEISYKPLREQNDFFMANYY